ncbi:MAG: hypothetical protein Q4C13_07190 [Clostridia bacterium]|nr:hypothetical protein [Clostridia bacterium]
MKKNRYRAIAAALLACLLALSACQRKSDPGAPAPTGTAPAATDLALQDATAAPESTASAAPADDAEDARKAYAAALDDVLQRHVLPDGTDLGFDPNADASGNRFAIFDVDADGREELIVTYASTYTAGQIAAVYDYDAGSRSLRPELSEYPLLTFYGNGAVKALWSHNQGLAGRFWPFSLYRYDASEDRYVLTGRVDAWDKQFAGTDAEGNAFPDAVDASGSGFVYYITEGGGTETVQPVDEAAYLAWYNTHVGDAAELSVPYRALTQESLQQLP